MSFQAYLGEFMILTISAEIISYFHLDCYSTMKIFQNQLPKAPMASMCTAAGYPDNFSK